MLGIVCPELSSCLCQVLGVQPQRQPVEADLTELDFAVERPAEIRGDPVVHPRLDRPKLTPIPTAAIAITAIRMPTMMRGRLLTA